MAAPTFVAEFESVWNTSTSPKTTGTITSLTVGEVLVSAMGDENKSTSQDMTWTNSGTAQTWTEIAAPGTNDADCYVQLAHATMATAQSMTVTCTRTAAGTGGSTDWWGHNVLRFSGTDGVGASASSGTAQSLSITTTQDNSAVVLILADWNANDWTSPTPWLDLNSQDTVEVSRFRDASHYAVAVAYCPDVGAAGSKTVGTSGLSGTFVLLAIEIKGTSGGSPQTVTPTGIATGGALGSPAITTTITASPTGIATGAATGTPTVSTSITVSPSGIATGAATGASSVSTAVTASPTGIASAGAVGAPTLSAIITVTPAGISATTELGTPQVTTTVTVSPTGIATGEAVGAPTIVGSGTVTPDGVSSSTAIGTPSISTSISVAPSGIGTGMALGTPVVTGGSAPSTAERNTPWTLTVTTGADYTTILTPLPDRDLTTTTPPDWDAAATTTERTLELEI